jgi:hypothetical protein
VSFRFSPGTMDSMAGVFAPAKKYRLGSGGGKAKGTKAGGTMLGLAVASMFPKAASSSTSSRPSAQSKRAFGGGTQTRMSGRAVMTMERTARRVPEVMVRVTGRQHGGGHVLANFSYISRLGHGAEKELGLYTSDGDVVRDGRDMQILAQDWHEWEMDGDARRKGATSISMILSMPTGTDPERLKDAALDFAREEFANRAWVASLHVDREHPHVHLTFARRDHDGRRFHPDRDDLFRYRQRFAEKLRNRGIEANATPAKARGIDPKHEPIAARKMRDRGLAPRLDKTRAGRAQQYRDRGVSDPVEAILASRQAAVRLAYTTSIAELSSSPSLADKAIAKSLERFIAAMPAPEPNSTRATRDKAVEREQARSTAVVQERQHGDPVPDPLAAALARSQAMREQIEALKARSGTTMESETEPGNNRPSGVSDRLRSLMQEAARQSAAQAPNSAEDVLREIQDRDRAARDRDRSPGKSGPTR